MIDAAIARVPSSVSLSPSSPDVLAAVYAAQELVGSVDQAEIVTEHLIHGGMYARTLRLGAGVVIVGALLKVPTVVLVHGEVDVFNGDGWVRLEGFSVLAGSAMRKQVFVTRSAVEMTSVFPTTAGTVEEAERAMTDEYEELMSHASALDKVWITGE